MKRVLLGTLAAFTVAAACAAAAPAASSFQQGPWYWTSFWCKNELQQQGMELYDGRTFNVAKAYCVGKGGLATCEWSSNYRTRLYTEFTVIARSYDGTVRIFTLDTNGKTGYRATNIRAVAHEENPYRFAGYVSTLTHDLAVTENAKGCARYTP